MADSISAQKIADISKAYASLRTHEMATPTLTFMHTRSH